MDKNRSNGKALFWLIVLVGGLFVGYQILDQAVDSPPEEPPWTAVTMVMATALLLVLIKAERVTRLETLLLGWLWQPIRRFTSPWRAYGRSLTLLLSFILTAYTLIRLPAMNSGADSFRSVFVAWLLSFLLFVLVVAPAKFWRREMDWPAWWKAHKLEAGAITAVLLLALFLRVWQIGIIPFALAGDEASQGLEAIRVLKGEIRNPFSTGWLSVPTMSFFYNSITIDLLGRTITGLRLPWSMIGTATILTTFLLIKQLKGRRLAFVVALLVAVYHYHIHFSRLGSNQVADPFFLSLSLLFLYRALDKQSSVYWALTGGTAGLALYFYVGARLAIIIITVIIAYEFIRNPRQFWQQHRQGVLILIVGFLLVGAPMIQYAVRFPDDFNARLNQVGIIQSGWLAREIDIREESAAAVLWDQFRRAALAFNFYPDRTVWYGLPKPLLDPFFGTLFLFGLGFGTLKLLGKTADTRTAPMVIWWWGGMLLGGMLTESPPSSQRLMTLALPACYFIGLAIGELTEQARTSIPRLSRNGVFAFGVLVFALISLSTYFVTFTPQRLYGGSNAEMATEIAPDLVQLVPNHHIYFAGAPVMFWEFATLPYLVEGAEAIDVTETLTTPLSPDLVATDKGAVFVFIPQRVEEINSVQQAFPDGRRVDYFSPVDGRSLATLYIFPPTE